MRVIPPYDLFFAVLYALLIPLVGMLVFSLAGFGEVLIVLPLLLALYLALALRRPLRRRRAAAAEFPGPWREFLLGRSAYYRGLDDGGRSRFERDVRLFLAEVRVAVTVTGSPAPWQTRLLVGAAAATMLHGRPDWEPPLRDGVTVYPGFAFDRNYQAGQGNIAGQAPAGGPLLVAEKSLIEGFSDARGGANVMVHELAHYFDLEARKGGLEVAAAGRRVPWGEAIDREYGGHEFAASVLPAYAAQNEAEFFACASEVFFGDPGRLAAAHPGLFSLVREFYGQDPRDTIRDGSL